MNFLQLGSCARTIEDVLANSGQGRSASAAGSLRLTPPRLTEPLVSATGLTRLPRCSLCAQPGESAPGAPLDEHCAKVGQSAVPPARHKRRAPLPRRPSCSPAQPKELSCLASCFSSLARGVPSAWGWRPVPVHNLRAPRAPSVNQVKSAYSPEYAPIDAPRMPSIWLPKDGSMSMNDEIRSPPTQRRAQLASPCRSNAPGARARRRRHRPHGCERRPSRGVPRRCASPTRDPGPARYRSRARRG